MRNVVRYCLFFICLFAYDSHAFGQNKYAVLVGVEAYDTGTFENLNYTEEDATRLGEVLDDFGYKTTVMTSANKSAKLQPYSAKNIWTVVETRVKSCEKGDTLLISLSGHGIQFKDDEELQTGVKDTFFCPSNADLGDKGSLISIKKLIELINSSKASRKLLLIDACRNEVISKAGQNKSTGKKIQLESVHEGRNSVPGGMSVLFSCSSKQFSWESNELKRSVFSHFVTEYLEGNADEHLYESGRLTLDNLVAFVRKKTNDYVFDNNFSTDGQYPVIRGESANWPLADLTEFNLLSSTDLDTVRRHAKLGVVDAQIMLGNRLEDGQGVEQDYDKALDWFLKAAKQDQKTAPFFIGLMYYKGQGVGLDYDKAMEWFLKSAIHDHRTAQYFVGVMHRDALGVDQDYTKAMEWILKAAVQGADYAQSDIGIMYHQGLGVDQDHEKAMEWFLKATKENYVTAQNNVAYMYENGYGVSKDYGKAMEWYLKAANQGDATSQNNIGELYYHGRGVPQDYDEAMQWFQKAAAQDHATSSCNIATMFREGNGVTQDHDKTMEWYLKAAMQGSLVAQNGIGDMYHKGIGVSQDDGVAMEWLLKAAMQGYSQSQTNVGFFYQNGYGVPKDYVKAMEWYQKAAKQNDATAHNNIGHLYLRGLGVERDYDKAKYWFQKAVELGHEEAKEALEYLKRLDD